MTHYPIAAEALDLEIYQLSCLFAASRELTKLSKKNSSLQSLVNAFELSEVSKKLISIAVTLRSFLDCNPKQNSKETTGTLVKDTEEHIVQPLDFREACNKIIHATDIEFFKNCDPDNGLHWSLTLFGKKDNKQWEASLDILQFIVIAHKLT